MTEEKPYSETNKTKTEIFKELKNKLNKINPELLNEIEEIKEQMDFIIKSRKKININYKKSKEYLEKNFTKIDINKYPIRMKNMKEVYLLIPEQHIFDKLSNSKYKTPYFLKIS